MHNGLNKLRLIGQQVISQWFNDRYNILCNELSNLSTYKNDVSLDKSFYWIWHYIFGVANRELVKEGLFTDPYDEGREFKGFIPAVYKFDVVEVTIRSIADIGSITLILQSSPLSSTTSATGLLVPVLFGGFSGTMGLSDSQRSYIMVVPLRFTMRTSVLQ